MHSGFVRTFLLPDSSPLLQRSNRAIQNTVSLLSDEVTRRIFLRKTGNRHLQRVQLRKGANSWETHDVSLSKAQYSQLLPLASEKSFRFSSIHLQVTGHPACIRIFENELAGLKLICVRFRDDSSAHQWQVPEDFGFGPEVTYHRNFADFSLLTDPKGALDAPTETFSHKSNFVVGVIPYLPLSTGTELVTVQTRKKRLLIFPKGQPEPNLTAAEVAKLEAVEEAGIEGEFTSHPILIPFKTHTPRHWLLYPMEVKTIQNEWKEKGLRNRSLVKMTEASGNPSYLRLAPALTFLTSFLEAHNPTVSSLKVS